MIRTSFLREKCGAATVARNSSASNDEPNHGATKAATVDDAQVYKCERATNVEIFYHELGDELAKKRLPFLNDLLRQLLTISISLAGGGLYFLDDQTCPGVLFTLHSRVG